MPKTKTVGLLKDHFFLVALKLPLRNRFGCFEEIKSRLWSTKPRLDDKICFKDICAPFKNSLYVSSASRKRVPGFPDWSVILGNVVLRRREWLPKSSYLFRRSVSYLSLHNDFRFYVGV